MEMPGLADFSPGQAPGELVTLLIFAGQTVDVRWSSRWSNCLYSLVKLLIFIGQTRWSNCLYSLVKLLIRWSNSLVKLPIFAGQIVDILWSKTLVKLLIFAGQTVDIRWSNSLVQLETATRRLAGREIRKAGQLHR